MRVLSGGLTCVNGATVGAVLLGMAAGGLRGWIALVCLLLGIAAGVIAATQTFDSQIAKGAQAAFTIADSGRRNYRRVWFRLVAACFGFFAFRSFCWLLFSDGNQLKVQSPNNLGDLSLHIAYIKNFAAGVPLWPENPIHPFSYLRYPAGTDIWNALLLLLGIDLTRGLIWAGLVGSLASFYALYRWGGAFAVAGFLFNGGLAGFQILRTWKWLDYQGDKTVAWKSLPLSMFVTQRGLLYALPAGLLLLYQWRAKYFQGAAASKQPSVKNDERFGSSAPLPFWVEITLYATMPLFHLHTFIALSVVAAFLFALGDTSLRKHLGTLVAAAFL